MTITQAEVLTKLAKNNMNVAATARELYMHRNTVDYHVRQIHKKTGLNPLSFYDMGELLKKATAVLEGERDD